MPVNGGLTEDQRLLLFGVGGWPMVWCLANPDAGIPYLMQSMWGSTTLRNGVEKLRPTWHGFDCGRGKIAAGVLSSDEHPAEVSVAQLRRYARSVAPELTRRLAANYAETVRLNTMSFHLTHNVGEPRCLDHNRPDWSKSLRRQDIWHYQRLNAVAAIDLLREALALNTREPRDLLELLETQCLSATQ